MNEEIRQFKAEIAQTSLSSGEKESAWKRFQKDFIRRRESTRREHARMKKAAEEFERHGRPMGGAKDD
jgi:Na+-translocating ferredoxin:NAD+ oxidoreductase RnfC subunit